MAKPNISPLLTAPTRFPHDLSIASLARDHDLGCITPNEGKPTVYPKARLDALSDGIFGVAMTLLVLDVRLPDDFTPHDADDLSRGLLALGLKFCLTC